MKGILQNHSASCRNPKKSAIKGKVDQNYGCLKICSLNCENMCQIGTVLSLRRFNRHKRNSVFVYSIQIGVERTRNIWYNIVLNTIPSKFNTKATFGFPRGPSVSRHCGTLSCPLVLCWGHTSHQLHGWFCNASRQLCYTLGVFLLILLTEP